MNKKPDKTATQEIHLPQSKTDYGDNFDESPLRNDTKRKKGKQGIPFYKKISKKQLIIISSCVLVVIIVIVIVIAIVFVSLSSSKVEKKEETKISSLISTSKEEKKYTTSINNKYYNEDTQPKYLYTEESTTQAPSTEIATTIQPTTQVTETSKQIETTDSSTVSFETEATTYTEKILSVDDISLIKTDDNLIICTVNGIFDGYSDEELLNFVSISSTFGTPIISSPSLNGSTFSFYISLSDECDGELCIHFGNYDYYQPISSMN